MNGVDLDWEQIRTEQEFHSYLKLIHEASSVLHEKKLILSVALHAGQFLPKEIYDHIDRIHLMTYDMIVSQGSKNHHASYKNGKFMM